MKCLTNTRIKGAFRGATVLHNNVVRLVGKPAPTVYFNVDELERMGFVGLYEVENEDEGCKVE